MPRKKAKDQAAVLTLPVIIRLTKAAFERLESKRKESDCSTIGEVARKILSNKSIKCFYKDVTLNPVMEELAMIRKELKAIGININQVTRTFNQDKAENHRTFYVLKIADQYKKGDAIVDRLLVLISLLAERWLQK